MALVVEYVIMLVVGYGTMSARGVRYGSILRLVKYGTMALVWCGTMSARGDYSVRY